MKVKDLVVKDFLKIDIRETLARFIGMILNHPYNDALVFDKKRYVGAIGRQWMLKARTELIKAKPRLKTVLIHPYVAKPSDDTKKVAEMLFVSDSRILPVKEKSQIIGIVKVEDVIKQIRSKEIAEHIATKPITVLHLKDRLGDAINTMKEKRIGRVPVVDNKGELVGIVTTRDLIEKYLGWPRKWDAGFKERPLTSGTKAFRAEKDVLLSLPVQNVMKIHNIVTANPKDTVTQIVDLMVKEEVPSVILVKERKPVGIVTTRDLLRFYVTQM